MSKNTIKVYFNNGCTTLLYNDQTTVEDIIRVVIKGKLSLNELRYKRCFQLRSTRFSKSNKDFDPLFLPSTTFNQPNVNINLASIPVIEDFFWLTSDLRIKDWIGSIRAEEKHNDLNLWK